MNRRDVRSQEQFEKDIADYTKREQYLMWLYVQDCLNRHIDIEYYDNGCDNTGQLLKRASSDPDFLVCMNDIKFFIDVKFASTNKHAIFKVHSLNAYLRQDNTYMLVFFNTTDKKFGRHASEIKKRKGDLKYCLVNQEIMRKMIDDLPHFHFSGFGGKLAVKVPSSDYGIYFPDMKDLIL